MPEPENANETVWMQFDTAGNAIESRPGGCLVFDSPADVWAWVRERLLTDEAVGAGQEALVAEVDSRLAWNVKAYGKAWTGEGEDTDFICGGGARTATAAAIDHAAAADQGKEGKGNA